MLAIITAVILGTVMMFLGLRNRENLYLPAIVMSALLVGMVAYTYTTGQDLNIEGMYDFYEFTRERLFIALVLSVGFMFYVILLGRSVDAIGRHDGELFALLFFVMCGILQIVFYNHLLTLFLGIETLSIPLYVLAGSDKENMKSSEASLKYFLMGAFTTGILLLGIALIYGATGSFDLNVAKVYFSDDMGTSMSIIGVALIIIAIAFKSSLVPFHFWTPDVYDGAPTSITAFMSTIVKGAVVYAMYIFVTHATGMMFGHWQIILSILAAATLILGNITAVYQQSVKRMLAYSSIAQAGYMILPIVALTDDSVGHMALYFITYIAANLGVFTVLDRMEDYTYDGFLQLGRTQPFLAVAVTIFFLSLAGLPVTGGFFAKLMAIMQTMSYADLVWLGVLALIMAAVGVYYYFRPIWAMYFRTGEPGQMKSLSNTQVFVITILAILVIILGIYPEAFSGYLS